MTPTFKGLAMAHPEYPQDLDALRCSWYYTWGCDRKRRADPRYVPMTRGGDVPQLPPDYSGYLLVFNEPNNPEPFGCNLSPEDAAGRYALLDFTFPSARLVVGGVSAWATDWVRAFCDELNSYHHPVVIPRYWHAHGYVEDWIRPEHLIGWWRDLRAITGGVYWITELGDVSGDVDSLRQIVGWCKRTPWVTRFAAYTNRQHGEAWNIGAGVELLTRAGELTECGKYYARVRKE